MNGTFKGLCGLRIGNFKAFAETQQISIRPLTLIYGANSAGKSSVIHSLLLANHALENGNVDVHQTKIGGASLDLGGFSQYVHLSLILRHANLLMFIDPHLDPSRAGYDEFIRLLLSAIRPGNCAPRIQIHRVSYVGHGPARRLLNQKEWQEAFESLQPPLVSTGLSADVFIWDDFHDRYLLTNLIGILMGNGFDVSQASNAMTTWARLSRNDRWRVEREFDYPNNAFHQLHGKFTIGR